MKFGLFPFGVILSEAKDLSMPHAQALLFCLHHGE